MPFRDLAERLAEVRTRVGDAVARGGHGQAVTVVGVIKTYGPEAALAAWEAGLRDVGENKVQEALVKMPQVKVALHWHLIGHLQRNKVKQIDAFDLIHSMDSGRLADALASHGAARGRPVEVLAQVNVSGEETKGGYQPSMFVQEADRLRELSGIVVRGVMTMAPFGADDATLRSVFTGARRCAEVLRAAGHPAVELSMGMSGDYEVAVEEGATLIRLGTVLFGARAA
ncbi:MAG TPA: YggS family pyridoxal phosphate-dependent enzyme [Gemmatimonadaceae bacterium]|nr:YggS family pyridoxal phosphate-dependent enzyme [Gemmatimonadaceae bacterium]